MLQETFILLQQLFYFGTSARALKNKINVSCSILCYFKDARII